MSKNTFFKVHNDASQAERRTVLRNERATYHGIATAEANAVGGRFARQTSGTVIGDTSVAYPVLPETSPWHHDPVGQEPPIGIDVSATEPVGTHAEIEASLLREAREARCDPAKTSSSASSKVGGAPPGLLPHASASTRPRRLSKRKP
jgi:hypothetical protein